MAARIQVVVEAKDATAGVFRALTSQMGAFGGLVEEVTAKNVSWGNVAQQATTLVINGLKDAIKHTAGYANEVRGLSLVSGQSAEESSRFLQVLDDYNLSAEDAMTATRALTKEGFAPNIETVAQLSDEYLKLSSAEERNAFVIKNLGRAGLQWTDILNKGSAALRAQGDAVADGLILSQQQVDSAREMEIAQDALNESWEQVSLTIGNVGIPILTESMDYINNTTRAIEIMREQGLNPLTEMLVNGDGYIAALKQANDETLAQRAAMLQSAEAIDQNTISMEAQAAAAKVITEENKTFISTLSSVGGALEAYNQGVTDSYAAYKNGERTIDEHKAKVKELAEEYEKTKDSVALSILEMKLAADGWTNADVAAYLKAGRQLGVFTEQQVRETQIIIAEADKLVAGYGNMGEQIYHTGERALDAADNFGVLSDSAVALSETVPDASAAVGGLKSNINSLPPSGTAWQYSFTINVKGRVPNLPDIASNTANADQFDYHNQQGGAVFAGVPSWVGEAGMEPFIPSQNGRILGHAESLHAMTLGGGGNSTTIYAYGAVNVSGDGVTSDGSDIMGWR